MQNTFSFGCMLLFTNMYFSCKHGGGVSTLAHFDGHIYPVIISPLLCIMSFVVVYA